MNKFKKWSKQLTIGLALGGGGARGLAHIGVLKVLEEYGIKPKIIVGTSMGSIIGALYAYLQDATLLETKLLAHLQSQELSELGLTRFTKKNNQNTFSQNLQTALSHLTAMYMLTTAVTKTHLIEEEKFKSLISLLLPEINIETLPIKFAAVATDLKQGLPHVFDQGSLQQATAASAAIPGIFPPVEINDTQLIDGACLALVPVEQAIQLGAAFTIAIDVSPPTQTDKTYTNGMDIWFRADQITSLALRNHSLKQSDFNITFEDLTYNWHDFQSVTSLIADGEKRTRALMSQLESKLNQTHPLSWWNRWFKG